MFKTTILLAFLLLLANEVYGQNADSSIPKVGEGSMTTSFTFRGREYRYRLSSEDLKDAPTWNPTAGEPPLSVARATQIASDNFSMVDRGPGPWRIGTIILEELGNEKWYYSIKFICLGCKEIGGFTTLVTMDGSVVEPLVKKVKKSVLNKPARW